MKVLYFARFRQAIGRGMEDVAPPAQVKTVRELMSWLMARDEGVAAALADLRVVKVAVNQKHAALDASLEGATEVAFFPPVTGG
jgi:molybdopterin synthase sulfur carrier subunit